MKRLLKPFPLLAPVFVLLMASVVGSAALAASTAASAGPDNCALRIGSGPDGKLYELMAQDIARVCGAEVGVCSVPSTGGIPNLVALAASRAELGMVQLDTLLQMARGGDERMAELEAVMPLHINLLHVLALREGAPVKEGLMGLRSGRRLIRRFSDLRGLRVAVVGSTRLLGQTLNRLGNLDMSLQVVDTDEQALQMLRANQVQAVFTDGGWPLPAIDRLDTASGLVLVGYDGPVPPAFRTVQRSYPQLEAWNLPFLGSPNLLVGRPFSPSGTIGRQVAALRACLIRQLSELQQGRYQAAWRDIKDPLDTLGVARFGGAPAAVTAARPTHSKQAKR